MPPITPRAFRNTRRVRRSNQVSRVWSTTDHELYFLWLHFQLKKDGDKPNHAAVAAKLNITTREAVKRFTQLKKQMEQMENTVEPEPMTPDSPETPESPQDEERKKARYDFRNDPIDKIFMDMDIVFQKYDVCQLR